jgi:hypothetical protein
MANDEKRDVQRDWTIMVYMVADDMLANFAVQSLKQLKDAASDKVAVAAQLGIDWFPSSLADAGKKSDRRLRRRYIFNRAGTSTISINDREFVDSELQPDPNTEMATQASLTEFINWAHKVCPAERYCLFVWGHGPECLYEVPALLRRRANQEHPAGARQSTGNDNAGGMEAANLDNLHEVRRLYFTPKKLAAAIHASELITTLNPETKRTDNGAGSKSKIFEIIAMDACSMSMLEFAYELRGVANYMIASQEEVPDTSFPYRGLLKHFDGTIAGEELCRKILSEYWNEYRDCFYGPTGMRPAMLSGLRLGAIPQVAEPLGDLATSLSFPAGGEVAKAIHKARVESRGFVSGLFVDLRSFCAELGNQLEDKLKSINRTAAFQAQCQLLREQCQSILNAIQDIVVQVESAPEANPDAAYGLSIYFPLLTDADEKKIHEFQLIKGVGGSQGDTGGGKGALVNSVARELQHEAREALIRDVEAFYLNDIEECQRGKASDNNDYGLARIGWYTFIHNQWSRILAETYPHELNLRYSGEQCAENMLTNIVTPGKKADCARAG